MKKNVLIAVSGGIAAYKVCDLVSKLTQKGYDVKVIMTQSAEKFVAGLTFETLSHNKTYVDGNHFDDDGIVHIELAKWADIALVAPATANTISKLVHGLADNLVTSTLLACTCPVLLAPAMNTNMLNNPVTQKNLELARSFGFGILESESGMLACGVSGKGRLPSTDILIQFIEQSLHLQKTPTIEELSKLHFETLEKNDNTTILNYAKILERVKPLKNTKVVVSAGPTVEAIDPVRFISNHSTGKQGYAIAKAARNWGADVTLVSGPVHLKPPKNVNFVPVRSALQMNEAMQEAAADADYIIMAAAVADYRPKNVSDQKIKKHDSSIQIELESNPDILMELSKNKKGEQIICGFAMETQNLEQNAIEKLERKKLDMIVANSLVEEGAGFGGSTNIVTFLKKDGSSKKLPKLSKKAVAYRLLAELLQIKDSQKEQPL